MRRSSGSTVEQDDEVKLDRLYGARDNLKIWAFGRRLEKEVAWSWGAVENVVWEGHDAYTDLQPGLAQITLVAGWQPPPQARRNVDLVLLTMDEKQLEQRIEEERYLPLDGMLTHTGDVWMEVTNTGQAEVTVTSLQYPGGPWRQHSPYWVHMRAWQPVSLAVGPGECSDWIEVGSTMDALNDGQWGFESNGPCRIAFGVKDAAGQIERIAAFAAYGRLLLAGHADTRYSRLVRTQEQALYELLDRLKNIPVHGRIPRP